MLPKIVVDLAKLRHNAAAMCALCAPHGISVTAVTKVFCADETMTKAITATPVQILADARLENLARYPAISQKRLLVRAPAPAQAAQVVAGCELSVNSELATLRALATAAEAAQTPHGILLMVDVGDLREGLWHADYATILQAAAFAANHPWLHLYGVGLNLACYGSVIPTPATMQRFAAVANRLQTDLQMQFDLVSGGNSSGIELMMAGDMPSIVNNLRFGESIVCGEEAAFGHPVPGLYRDVVALHAALIEIQEKPSYPQGLMAMNAFRETPRYEDKGRRLRGLLSIGRQDTDHEALCCLNPGITIIGASSDHLLVDLTEAEEKFAVGDTLQFSMGYRAILRGFTSPFVAREYIGS